MLVNNYNKLIDYAKLVIGPMEKVGDSNYRVCPITYSNELFLIQTPKTRFDLDNKTLLINNKLFLECIETLRCNVIEYLENNSKEIFNSKLFTKENLDIKLLPLFKDDYLQINNESFDNVKIIDQFKEQSTIDDVINNNNTVSCIIRISELQVHKNNLVLIIHITNFKVYYGRLNEFGRKILVKPRKDVVSKSVKQIETAENFF